MEDTLLLLPPSSSSSSPFSLHLPSKKKKKKKTEISSLYISMVNISQILTVGTMTLAGQQQKETNIKWQAGGHPSITAFKHPCCVCCCTGFFVAFTPASG